MAGWQNSPETANRTSQDLNPAMFESAYLQTVERMFSKQYNAGMQVCTIEVLTVGTTAACLYLSSKIVRDGTIQSLSSTDTITLGGGGAGNIGRTVPIVAGTGFILNPAAAAGQSGGTWNFGNIDLASITAISSTNTGQKIAVVYYN